MTKLHKSEWIILIVLLALSFVPCIGGIFRLIQLELNTALEIIPENPRALSSPIPVEIHIISSVLYCILGAFQFLPNVRRNYTKWHQLSGRLLVCAGILAALSGLWMTHFYSFPESLQGNLLYVVRIIVGFSMVMCIFLGVSSVLKRRIELHQAWMIRGYALGQGAGTQVMITIPGMLTVGEPIGFERDVLMSTAWVINLVVAELIIRRKTIEIFVSSRLARATLSSR